MGDRKQNPTTTAMHTEVGNMGVNTSKNTEKTIQGPITIELANLCTQVQVITNIIPIPCPRVCLNHSSRYMLLSNLATRSCILRIPHAPSALPISISRTVTRLYHAGVDLCRRSRSHRHSMDFLGGVGSCWKHSLVNQDSRHASLQLWNELWATPNTLSDFHPLFGPAWLANPSCLLFLATIPLSYETYTTNQDYTTSNTADPTMASGAQSKNQYWDPVRDACAKS